MCRDDGKGDVIFSRGSGVCLPLDRKYTLILAKVGFRSKPC